MVDREKRRTIRNVGAGIAVLLGGGGGAALYGDEMAEGFQEWQEAREQRQREKQERQEQERRRRQKKQVETWSEEIEEAVADDLADQYNWGDAEIDFEDVQVTYEKVGETKEGGLAYAFTITGPLREDSRVEICDYAETREAERQLAGLLGRSAVVLHEYLYAWLDAAIPRHRNPDDLRVTSFTTAFEDETGRAEATLDWRTVDRIAQGDDFHYDYWPERTAYLQEYQLAFDVECDTNG